MYVPTYEQRIINILKYAELFFFLTKLKGTRFFPIKIPTLKSYPRNEIKKSKVNSFSLKYKPRNASQKKKK